MDCILNISNIDKDFIFHHQNSTRVSVLNDFSANFYSGEATVLKGRSGTGKSTLLKMIYGGYRTESGSILVKHHRKCVDIASADPTTIYEIRRDTIGYVSQFLRVVPRISALDTVIEPLLARSSDESKAIKMGMEILERLRIPQNLWHLSASTFSGGEQQRINLARGFIANYPVMLLDEPTASLDPCNRQTVLELIREAVKKGSCVIGVFHNRSDQEMIADKTLEMSQHEKNLEEV